MQSTGSRARGLSGSGSQAWLLESMWGLPGSVFPALVDGFFTTEPPGKPGEHLFALHINLLGLLLSKDSHRLGGLNNRSLFSHSSGG